jgi:hypothetical protein
VPTGVLLQCWIYKWQDYLTILGDHVKQVLIVP